MPNINGKTQILESFLAFACSMLLLAQLAISAYSASSFGTDYRHLTGTSPGSTADMTTSVTLASGISATFIVNPLTSGSTSTGSPSSSSTSGYGWRTSGVFGSVIPSGTWTFSTTTKSSLIGGTAVVRVFAYSSDTLGTNIASIGSATGTLNVLGSILDQQQALSFTTSSSTDLTARVLILEFWIDVTSAPLLSTTITFNSGSSSQTVVMPTSGTYYLGTASLYSIGESEAIALTDSGVRSISSTRSINVTASMTDSSSRIAQFGRQIIVASGSSVTDIVSNSAHYVRAAAESLGMISNGVSTPAHYSRMVTESSGALITDLTERILASVRIVSESNLIIDTVARFAAFDRELIESASSVSEFLAGILNPTSPPDEENDDDEDGQDRNNKSRRTAVGPGISDSELDRAIFLSISLLDKDGASVVYSQVNDQIHITSKIKNQQESDRKYVLIIQVLDDQNMVTDITIMNGSIEEGGTITVSDPWLAGDPGEYQIKLLLLDNLGYAPSLLTRMEVRTVTVL